MIRLATEPYCDTCQEFEPVLIERPMGLYSDRSSEPEEIVGDNIVGCTHRFKCLGIYNRVMNEVTENARRASESNHSV